MDSFKKALKQAIQENAEAVRIEDGQHPQLLHSSSEKPLLNLPKMHLNDVQNLIEALVSSGDELGDNAREGVLAIVNYGEIKLIAELTTPLKLYAFIPPQGTQMHQQIRNQILGAAKPAPAPFDLPPAVPSSSPAEVGGEREAGFDPRLGKFTMIAGEESGMRELPSHAPPKTPITPDFDSIPIYIPSHSNANQVIPLHPTTLAGSHTDFESMNTKFDELPASDLSSADLDYHYGSQASEEVDAMKAHAFIPEAKAYIPREDFASPQPFPEQVQSPFASAQPYAPVSSHAQVQEAPAEIHFGASIPGETIDRDGREFPLDSILQEMIRRKASDLHLTQGEILCMRIDGEIERIGGEKLTEARMKELLLPIIPPRNREEFSKISDTDFAYEVPGLARFRVNVFRDRMGVGAVLRQIPEKILSAEDLGLPPAVRKFCELNKGLVVVTGPTGSGKSTTLAGMIDLINTTRSEHILTIEDPIEFVHKQKKCLINQREVHKHTQSFSRALRAALREDPDIILIGEMRDLETVEIAIETAETGHLVFGTLHTNTAISTVDRLIDQFPADQQSQIRVMLAESLKGVVAQTLVRKKGGGRVAALEILVIDKAVASLIREGNTHMMGNHMQTQKAKGNILLNESLLNLVVKGIVDAKDAYMKAVEKDAFVAMLQSKGIALEVQKAS